MAAGRVDWAGRGQLGVREGIQLGLAVRCRARGPERGVRGWGHGSRSQAVAPQSRLRRPLGKGAPHRHSRQAPGLVGACPQRPSRRNSPAILRAGASWVRTGSPWGRPGSQPAALELTLSPSLPHPMTPTFSDTVAPECRLCSPRGWMV